MFKQHISFAFAAILLCFTACDKETFDPVLRLGEASAISAPADGTSFVIAEGTGEQEFAAFSWSAADFGFPSGASYSVEMDLAGNNFATPTAIVPAANALTASVKNSKVNSFLIGRGISGGTQQAVEVRVKAAVGQAADNNVLYSSPITLNVTPFEAAIEYPKLYVPGAYQGWNPADEETVIYSVPENGIYDGYAYFPDPSTAFKFTDAPNWDNGNFGDNEPDGVLDDSGSDIVATEAGMHRLNVNINDRTYTVTSTSWGLIGSATPTGWDSDTDMVYDAATGELTLTLDLTGGADNFIKFRANNAWDLNLGDNDADQEMEYGGADIAITESGNYTVKLLLNQPIYTYELIKN